MQKRNNASRIAKRGDTKTGAFADALADGMGVEDAAATVGWTRKQGNGALQRIRQMLGAQAI